MSLKKFEILEMIAKGGMAEVYRARTTGLQGFEKEVCVKKILPHLTEDDAFVTMFINEAKLAATLSYANIVQVHDLCVSAGGEYFIVMEYVDGKDLSDVIRAAQLAGREVPPEIAVHVVREVCQGLAYAHGRTDREGAPLHIIHRDISPHNVLVSFMGEVKIVDFGIAKASSNMSKTAVGILKGKYGYMSPEQARGQPLDPRSDIFNTGIVLYEMLVGERCFAGSSDFSTLNLMRNAEVAPPRSVNPKVPPSLEAIVLKALSKDKADRPQSALELERLLGEWARAESCVATKGDLARFVQDLFRGGEAPASGPSTGVLEVKSVVGPAPEAEAPPSEASAPKPPPRRATERSASLADRPVAAAAAPDVDPSKGDEGSQAAQPEPAPKADAPAAGRPEAERASAKQVASPAPGSPAGAPPGPEAQKDGPEKAEAASRSEPDPVAGDERAKNAEASPRSDEKRRPARLPSSRAAKKDGAAKKEGAAKKKGKQLATGPKRPVGRQHLRPGLSKVARAPSRRRTVFATAGVIVLAGALGLFVGRWRARSVTQESAFRQMELASRRAPAPETGLVLIESTPPGLETRLDGVRLAPTTPLAVERPRDDAPHRVELFSKGEPVHEAELSFDEGRLALHRAELDPEGDEATEPEATARLHVVGAEGARVRVDGEARGRVGASGIELAPGEHAIELRRRGRKRAFELSLEAGERRTLAVDL